MKVVKEGKWHVPWSGEYACKTCEAVLLVEESDVKPTYDACGRFYFTCAICGKDSDLPGKDLPLRVRETVEKKRKYSSSSDW